MKRWADLACLAILVAANPIFWFFDAGIFHVFSPDAIAYATLGREMVTNGTLYIPSWGHIDLGFILPPLYPLLIGLGSFFSDDLLRVASWISSASLILAGIPFALLIRDVTGRVVAVLAALLIPCSSLFNHAFAPLTEMLFIFMMALALLALSRSTESGAARSTVAIGVLCGIAFLVRPVGLFLLAFALMWVAIAAAAAAAAAARGERSRSIVRRVAAVLAGFLLIIGPWAIGLFIQTGQHPLQRDFRMGIYSVSSDDPEVLAEIRGIREFGQKDYNSLVRSRRMMRKLIPDATEMYENLEISTSSPDVDRSDLEKILDQIATQPFGVFENFVGNSRSLMRISGTWFFTLFVITSLTPVLIRRRGTPWQRRIMLSAWVWFYILSMSLITDLVSRYIIVVLPFLVLHIAMEVCALASMLSIIRVPGCRIVVCAALMMPPANSLAVTKAFDKFEVAYSAADPALYAPLREFIQEGDVVFSPAPFDAYLLGAGFRVLPDDSLDRVATYAERTGVRWLVVARKWHNRRQIELYDHQWYMELAFPTPDGPQLVKCCEADGGRIILYEFRSESARGRAAAGTAQGASIDDPPE